MKSLKNLLLEASNMNVFKNPKANYKAIDDFSLPNQQISLTSSSPTIGYVNFKKGDEIHITSQSGSLGDINYVTNLRTNEVAKCWSYDYGLPSEMKDKVKSKEAYRLESRIIKYDRTDWYLKLLKYTTTSKPKVIIAIYAGVSKYGTGINLSKVLSSNNISNYHDNVSIRKISSKKFENDIEANRYLESTVLPEFKTSGLPQDSVKLSVYNSRIDVEIISSSVLNDLSCFPPNWNGRDFKKKLTNFIAKVFYFDIEKCKELKEPETKKLPTIKAISSEEFQNKFLALCKKVDKGFGVKMLNLGEISDNAFKKAISDLPYDYLSTRSYSMDFEDIRRDRNAETVINKIFTIDSEKGERNSFIRGEIRFWRANKNYGIIQSTDITLSFKVATYNYTPFIPEEAFKYVEYYMKNEILKNIKLEPLEA